MSQKRLKKKQVFMPVQPSWKFLILCCLVLSSSLVNANEKTYIVQEGDNLSRIAKYFDIPYSEVRALAKTNGISNIDLIYPGQKLVLTDFIRAKQAQQKIDQPDPNPEAIQTLAETDGDEETLANETEAKDPEQTEMPQQQEDTSRESAENIMEEMPAQDLGSKPKPRIQWHELDIQLGLGLGMSRLDLGSENFAIGEQQVSIDNDDTAGHLQIFALLALKNNIGLELGLHELGKFSFKGDITGNNLGETNGEQHFQALSIGGYYEYPFTFINSRIGLGLMQIRQDSDATIDLIGKVAEDSSLSENSSNAYLSLELSKQLPDQWSIGPALLWVNSTDSIQSLSLRLYRPLNQ